MFDVDTDRRLTGIKLRELTVDDTASLRGHLLRLDAKDRFMRFCNVVDDKGVHRFVDSIDWRSSSFVGSFAGGMLRGVAQLSSLAEPDGGAEFAISVDRDHRGIGIARALMCAAVSLARERGLKSLVMTSLGDNGAINHLARNFGFELNPVQQQVIGELEL